MKSMVSRRLGLLGFAADVRRDRVVIRLPDPRVLRLLARHVVLAIAILASPWLLLRAATVIAAVRSGLNGGSGSAPPMLRRDPEHRGLYRPDGGFKMGGVDNTMVYGANANRLPRRLLAVPESKKEALNGLEDVMLEPPARGRGWRPRYLPELTGDTLDAYPRRVFVDVGGGGDWLERNYPRGRRGFDTIRVEVVDGDGAATGGMAEWLTRNVREEEYVVVKAEAEVVEEMVKGKAIGLVDELFLECRNQWEKREEKKGRRAYWECLALYGKLRDEGVAVHQWWG